MGKKLTLSAIEKETKKYKEQFKIEIGEYYVMIDKYFSPKKINTLIAEFGKMIKYIDKNENIDKDSFDSASLIFLYIIKYFTSLGESIPDKFEDQIVVLEALIDGEYLTQIINAMPDDEIVKLTNKIGEAKDSVEKFAAEMKKAEELDKKEMELDNKDLVN